MREQRTMTVTPAVAADLPSWSETVQWLNEPDRLRAVDVLSAAERPFVQPRCGVGGHGDMQTLLRTLDQAGPGLLSVTIDSHTRLGRFDVAGQVLRESPRDLNGYPLVTHGWRRGRELVEAVSVPLEVRHGSPEARDLFAHALAAGITSFEGGGIGYNLPYSKDVPLRDSLTSWQQIDALCGDLAEEGVLIDRELFGTLSAVLVPPSIALTTTLLEAFLAARAGVRCLSIAYPQTGEIHQDIAALRAIRSLARRYLPAEVEIFPVLHEFMGVFPRCWDCADALIMLGGLTARIGGATKVINKTRQEGWGLPDAEANCAGIRTARCGTSPLLDFVTLDEAVIADEQEWIEREVGELVDPVLAAADPVSAIVSAFATGRLDVPFSASIHARSAVVPGRDPAGAVRFRYIGQLPFSAAVRARNDERMGVNSAVASTRFVEVLTNDINHFCCDGTHAGSPVAPSDLGQRR